MVTVLAVRHADIDLPPRSADPELNAAGRVRAEVVASMIGESGIGSLFISEFIRTQQTAEPLARQLGLLPRPTPPAATLAQSARSGELGAVVFVAGHSNTVPAILAALGATPVPVVGEREFDNLFVLTTQPDDRAVLLNLRYGSSA